MELKHGGQGKKCKVVYVDLKGKKSYCGIPLDENGQCPTHGRPW